ncbi:NAD-dependent epimerase/dehydratase family protein [Micromonospora sp. AP08]|uniref:SDR family oxidoreductase n=1 Tax=Micromonospora sp. AP08 TaxID=2604467 RepID=UPI0011D3E3F0|nr:SDR family oxidoreductase [Micromonospora sp. AP08]TYB40266.1 NAD-dependent epimerase/dehydratase family protein [Micromonospora sp. AP08]
MNRAHVVTGGTGFVGLALILELLQRTDDDVVCLVRSGAQDPDTRLRSLLISAAGAYGRRVDIGERVRTVAGDVSRPDCGLVEPIRGPIADFWHSAASLRYEESAVAEIFTTNVDGTRHALDLADRLGAAAFNYVSTAYVTGTRDGVITERLIAPDGSNNAYERSKAAAEALVHAHTGTATRILRPSIVVGHSRTRAVVGSYTGMYGFQRRLAAFAQNLSVRAPERLRRPVRVLVDPGTPLNFVPVDAVVEQMVGIAASGSPERIFHLTNSTPPAAGDVLRRIFALAGLPEPEYVTDRSQLDDTDRAFAKGIEFYRSYLVGEKLFDRVNSDQALGRPDAGTMLFPDDEIVAYGRWYLDNVQRQRQQAPLGPSPAAQSAAQFAAPVGAPLAAPEPAGPTRIVLLGGGYTSVWTYKSLRRRLGRQVRRGDVEIVFVDPLGYHSFHGFTAEVLGGIIAEGHERSPLRTTCPLAQLVRGTAQHVDLARREVTVALVGTGGETLTLRYDHLVIGCGSHDDLARVPGLAEHGWSLKDPGGSAAVRERLLTQVELAEASPDEQTRRELLTVVVVGGGFTGVEMSATVAEILRSLRPRYRVLREIEPQVHLVHGGHELLPQLRPRFARLARYAQRQLTRAGVRLHLRTRVVRVDGDGAYLDDGSVLASGLVVSTLGQAVAALPGTERLESRDGRLVTDEYLRVRGAGSRVWSGGDQARVLHPVKGEPCPANALWAIKHGVWIGGNIAATLRRRAPRRFTYRGLGQAASLGVGKGAVELYGVQVTGWLGWLMRAGFFLWFMPSRRQAVRSLVDLLGAPLLGRRLTALATSGQPVLHRGPDRSEALNQPSRPLGQRDQQPRRQPERDRNEQVPRLGSTSTVPNP